LRLKKNTFLDIIFPRSVIGATKNIRCFVINIRRKERHTLIIHILIISYNNKSTVNSIFENIENLLSFD